MAISPDLLMKLSVEAYLLARECGRVSMTVQLFKERFSDKQVSVLSDELTFFNKRMTLLGGYFAGFITVEQSLDLDAEKNYMETCRSLLQTLNSVLEA